MEKPENKKKIFNMETFIADYRSKKLKIKVDLFLAKKILNSLDGNLTSILGCSFSLLPIIGATISVLFFGGAFGFLYVIAFTIILFLYLKICESTDTLKKILLFVFIICIPISIILDYKLAILIDFSCISLIYAYMYYYYIEWFIINEMAFFDERVLFIFFERGIFHFK